MKLSILLLSIFSILCVGCLLSEEEMAQFELLLKSSDLQSQLSGGKYVSSSEPADELEPVDGGGEAMARVTPDEYNWYIKNIYFLWCQSDGEPVSCTSDFTESAGDAVTAFDGTGDEYMRFTVQENSTPVKVILNSTGKSLESIEVDADEIQYIGAIQIEMIVEELKLGDDKVQIGGEATTLYVDQIMTDNSDTLAGISNFDSLTDDTLRGDQLFDLDLDGAFGFLSEGDESLTRPSSYGYNDDSIKDASRGIDVNVEWFNEENMSYLIPVRDPDAEVSSDPDEGGVAFALAAGTTYNASISVDYSDTFSYLDADEDNFFDADEEGEYESVFFGLPMTRLEVEAQE